MFECPDMFPLALDGEAAKIQWVVVNGDGPSCCNNLGVRKKCFSRHFSRLGRRWQTTVSGQAVM